MNLNKTQTYIPDYDHLFKIVITGDDGTGKSSFLSRYFDDSFSEKYNPSVKFFFHSKIKLYFSL